jgi:hypothetical protein
MLLLIAAMASAADIAGQNDSRFTAALDQWKAGEDAPALVKMAELANEGVPAAQVFLGQIYQQTWLHAHVTGGLPRKQRINLMRAPGGLSGKSWLSVAAEQTPLAQLLLDSGMPAKDISVGWALADAGETGLALTHISRVVNTTGDWLAGLQLATHPGLLEGASGFYQTIILRLPGYAQIGAVDLADPRLPEIEAALGSDFSIDAAGALMWVGPRDFEELMANPGKFRDAGDIILQDERVSLLADALREACPDDPGKAMAAIQFSRFGEPAFLMLMSPVESLLPTADYQESSRFPDDLRRRLSFVEQQHAFMSNLDSCAYEFAAGLR